MTAKEIIYTEQARGLQNAASVASLMLTTECLIAAAPAPSRAETEES